ncbi:uncharacterized protein FOMMEDRAFT_28562 [Fomitiporia mediterranea MF3/22]|uniref:uncharacterized protein n=1 Tax=Fomitiporia mediterranea (strain MF3/22) TaxID=694068 RepID=UPI0004407458|nr:uncharacterized protein FOMMEDRAFT_28562 [Fomitiporia mediterranea MF3/22]EJD02934.1 hypothetical protein FOMMEDRAFT_28562 [Fomitiporia mediterranea MF3/22]
MAMLYRLHYSVKDSSIEDLITSLGFIDARVKNAAAQKGHQLLVSGKNSKQNGVKWVLNISVNFPPHHMSAAVSLKKAVAVVPEAALAERDMELPELISGEGELPGPSQELEVTTEVSVPAIVSGGIRGFFDLRFWNATDTQLDFGLKDVTDILTACRPERGWDEVTQMAPSSAVVPEYSSSTENKKALSPSSGVQLMPVEIWES